MISTLSALLKLTDDKTLRNMSYIINFFDNI